MRTITLKSAWTYRTPTKTIDFPAGEYAVTEEIAAQAEAEGVIPKEESSGAANRPAAPRAPRSAGPGQG